MANFTWSLEMMILGMGTVFIMLILLMLLLVSIGQLDARTIKRQQRAGIGAKSESKLLPTSSQSNIAKDKLAAIAVAIVAHQQAQSKNPLLTPQEQELQTRSRESQWVIVGRYSQMRRTTR